MKKFFFFLFVFLFAESYAVTCAFESGREENQYLYSLEGLRPPVQLPVGEKEREMISQSEGGFDALRRNMSPVTYPTAHYIPYNVEELPFRLSP